TLELIVIVAIVLILVGSVYGAFVSRRASARNAKRVNEGPICRHSRRRRGQARLRGGCERNGIIARLSILTAVV
ncbi:MAG: hypothetical protein P8173_18345, partial [Gammaproteobacteria bacterium]